MVWRTFLYVATCYLVVVSALFLLQRKMLYLPGTLRLTSERIAKEGLRYWPSYEHYRGIIGKEINVEPKGTIVLFHGNAGTAYHRSFYINALSSLGYRVILAEYPGYGGREGQPSEEVLVNDALETLRLVYQRYGPPLYLWGESLGCGVVSSVVSRAEIPVQGVVLFLPWDSLPSLAQTHYWYLPARWLVLDEYNNIENLSRYNGRVAVLLAGEDEVIPVHHGKRLYSSIKTDKKLWVFDKTRHNEVPVGESLPWWKEVVEFISRQ